MVSSFTNEVGSFDHYRTVVNVLSAKNYYQALPTTIRDGFSLKNPPNKTGSRKGVKPYRRLVVGVTDLTPATFKSTDPQYPDNPSSYTRYYPGPLDTDETGEALGLAQNLVDQSITECLLNLREGRLSLGADLGEMRSTLDMMAQTSSQVLHSIRAARRGQWGHIPEILRMRKSDVLSGRYPANKFLEYQYGWKPLMGSIYDGALVLRDGRRNPNAMTFKAFATRRGNLQVTDEIAGGPGLLNRVRSYSYTSQTAMYYRVKSSVIDNLDSNGLLNPLSVAWELVPFSFVLDWFIPVGNTLSALSATAGLEFIDGYNSLKRLRSTSQHGKANPSDKRISVSNGGSYRSEGMDFARTKYSGFPMPRLYANMNPFSTSHVKSALALLRQLL